MSDVLLSMRQVLLLGHPNVIKYRLAEWKGNTLCLLMEYGDGGCIAGILCLYGALPCKVGSLRSRSAGLILACACDTLKTDELLLI